MGVESFKLLLEEINSKKMLLPFLPKTIELETGIIERESTL
jgi:LacI family transcriptional regulator